MARYLLTSSLFDNWRFYMNIESKEKQEFLDSLLKKEFVATPAMLEGRKFEDDVFKLTRNPKAQMHNHLQEIVGDNDYRGCVFEVAEIVHGGLWQQRVMFDATFHGMDFLVYGKIDVNNRDWIYDIKKTANYDLGKYGEAVQHPIYMVGAGLKKFKYVVTDGSAVYCEDYHMTPDLEKRLWSDLGALVESIMDDADFRRAYMENWKALGERQGSHRNDVSRILSAG